MRVKLGDPFLACLSVGAGSLFTLHSRGEQRMPASSLHFNLLKRLLLLKILFLLARIRIFKPTSISFRVSDTLVPSNDWPELAV